jgi:hypothetical protein
MTEEIEQQDTDVPTETSQEAETPEQKKIRLRERNTRSRRKARAEERLARLADASEEEQQSVRQKAWVKNLRALLPPQRKALDSRAEGFYYIGYDLLYQGSQRMKTEPYGHDDGIGIGMFPERWAAEVLDFIQEFPALQTNAEPRVGEYYKEFGLEVCDGLYEVRFTEFLRSFAEWYVRSRHTLVLHQDPADPFSRTWEQVDEIIGSNPRLKNYVAVAPSPRKAAPAPSVVSVPAFFTPEQRVAKTLEDLRKAGENAFGI